jgi:hypothetical protein
MLPVAQVPEIASDEDDVKMGDAGVTITGISGSDVFLVH